MDVGLPDMDGREAVKKVRRDGYRRPIIMLTAHDSDADAVQGLDSGANDYVGKPFRFMVLLARIRAQLRQYEASEDAEFQVGPYTFRPTSKNLVDAKGVKLRLTEKEAAILRFLHRADQQPVPRETLLKHVWGYNPNVTTHTLETHIYRLRQKIEDNPAEAQLLVTEAGGYRLVAADGGAVRVTLDADVARLARTRPFSLLPREAVQLVAFSCVKQRLKAGEALFAAGDEGDAGYFVQSGAILLEDRSAPAERKRRVDDGRADRRERPLRAGRPPGERPGRRRTQSLTRIPRETFRRVLAEFPEAADKIRAALAERTRRLVESLDAARVRSIDAAGAAEEPDMSAARAGVLAAPRADARGRRGAGRRRLRPPARAVSPPLPGAGHPGRRFPRRRDARRDGGGERVRPARPVPRPRTARIAARSARPGRCRT